MNIRNDVEVAVLGAGLAGIATAYYLCKSKPGMPVLLIDCRSPMSYTSAQSGDNYRNWWPHPVMTQFTNHSIDLMEQISRDSSNRINMTRRGYLLATRRRDIDPILTVLHSGYRASDADQIRLHKPGGSAGYAQNDAAWETAPRGVDVISDPRLIRQEFPSLSDDVSHVVHVRRAGDISGQQLGQYMLEELKATACRRLSAEIIALESAGGFRIDVDSGSGMQGVRAEQIVIAAGPFVQDIAAQLGCDLPVQNFYQQKIAFADALAAIPRSLPFACDLDDVIFNWNDEERQFLLEDPGTAWLAAPIAGGVHCRPEGGDHGSWIKIGWAYNQQASRPQAELENEPLKNEQFPEIAMRAAARLNPSLRQYLARFPAKFIHYGGYYTMTEENWPLIGPLEPPGAYIVGALSGFGSMSACAAGELCAAWISGSSLPDYAQALSLHRYADQALMTHLRNATSRGVL